MWPPAPAQVLGTASIVKIDSVTEANIAGATLEIRDSGGALVTTVTTGTSPTIISLPEGSYTATETAAPPGYLPNPTPVPFVIAPTSSFPVTVRVADALAPSITSSATEQQYRGHRITDTATISGIVPATGMELTFTAYGPSATPDCTGTPAFTSTLVAITTAGTYPLTESFVPTNAGTYYWVVSLRDVATGSVISGVCGAAGETSVVVTDPDLTSRATPTAVLGTPISDVATVTGDIIPGTTLTFDLFGPATAPNCDSPAYMSAPIDVTSPGDYTSPAVTPTATGSYYWVATLRTATGELLVAQQCGAPNEISVVTAAPQPTPVDPACTSGSGTGLADTGSQVIPPLGFAVALLTVGMTFILAQAVSRRTRRGER